MFTKLKSVLLASMLVLAAMTLSKAGTAQFVLYDNFASRNIDPSKWVGTFGDQDQREVVRTLVGEEGARHLRLSQTAYSATQQTMWDRAVTSSVFNFRFRVQLRRHCLLSSSVELKPLVAGATPNPL